MGGAEESTTEELEMNSGELGREELARFGKILDYTPMELKGRTVGMALAERPPQEAWAPV